MIPHGINITGNIDGSGHLRIDGTVRGDVMIKGRLEVGQSGRVQGDLQAEDVVVLGEVKGNVFSQNKLLLKTNCRIRGNIACKGLIVEEGAWLTGRCEMGSRERPDKSTYIDVKSKPPAQSSPLVDSKRSTPTPSPTGPTIQSKVG
jgi:cytoskeletal protein CcmA (bactofilin family)